MEIRLFKRRPKKFIFDGMLYVFKNILQNNHHFYCKLIFVRISYFLLYFVFNTNSIFKIIIDEY